MKQVRDVIAEYETVRKKVIKFVKRVHSREQPPTDDSGSLLNNDEVGGSETSIVNNEEDGGGKISIVNNEEDVGNEQNDNTEGRSSDDNTSTASDEVEVGSLVRKFFARMGWYNGTIEKITKSTPTDVKYEIRLTDGEVEKWSREIFTRYHLEASIHIGA